jgi:hypothetical protein
MYRRLYGTTEVETVPWKFLSALYDLADVATELEDMPEKLELALLEVNAAEPVFELAARTE